MLPEYKLKKELLKQHVSLEYKEEEKEGTLWYDVALFFENERKMKISAKVTKEGVLVVKNDATYIKNMYTLKEQAYIKELTHFFDSLAKKHACHSIFYKAKEFKDNFSQEALKKFFPSPTYFYLDSFVAREHTNNHFDFDYPSDVWIKTHKKTILRKVFLVKEKAVTIMENLEKTEATFHFFSKEYLKFYFLGFIGMLEIEIKEKEIVLKEKQLKIEVSIKENEKEEEKILLFFSQIKDKRKLKEMFEEPDYFFSKRCQSLPSTLFLDKSLKEHLHTYYSAKTLEEICAKEFKEKKDLTVLRDEFGYSVFEFAGRFVVAKTSEVLFSEEKSEKEKGIKRYQEMIKKQVEKMIEKIENFL